MAGRTYRTGAVVLRSIRFGEADVVLHLYTLARGRVGAVAKGVRRTRSRYGARLEPLSHVELMIHQGRGELGTVTGADLVRSHRQTREDPYRLGVGLVGAEAMLRLFSEQESNPRAFEAVTRFLEAADELDPRPGTAPGLDPLALSFQLKLLWLSGYLPQLERCAECGARPPLHGYLARSGGAVCRGCADDTTIPLAPSTFSAVERLLRRPLAEAGEAGVGPLEARQTLSVVAAACEYHGGFRLRSLSV